MASCDRPLILVRHMSAIAACTGLCSATRPTPSRPSYTSRVRVGTDTIARTADETLILCAKASSPDWKLDAATGERRGYCKYLEAHSVEMKDFNYQQSHALTEFMSQKCRIMQTRTS